MSSGWQAKPAQIAARRIVTCNCRFEIELDHQEELAVAVGRRDPQPRLVEDDQQDQRQHTDAREIERDAHSLVIAAIEPATGDVETDERRTEDEERPDDARDRAIEAIRRKVEETAGEQEERAEIKRDLRIGECATGDDPVVLPRIEVPVRGTQRGCLVGINEPQPQPLGNLIEMGSNASRERRRVLRRPRGDGAALDEAFESIRISRVD